MNYTKHALKYFATFYKLHSNTFSRYFLEFLNNNNNNTNSKILCYKLSYNTVFTKWGFITFSISITPFPAVRYTYIVFLVYDLYKSIYSPA